MSDQNKLFGREYKFFYKGPIGDDFTQTIEITGLHIAFDVKKTTHKDPNTATIKLWNLQESTRQSLKHRGARIHLEAGYKGDVPLIFAGDVREINHVREKGGWVSTIYAGDGERAITQATCIQSHQPKTPVPEVLSPCFDAFKKYGVTVDASAALGIPGTFDRGFSSTGLAADAVSKALEGTGYIWSIQDGRLLVRKETEPYRSFVYEWNPQSGLEGSPVHVTPKNTAQTPNTNLAISADKLGTPKDYPGKTNKSKGAQPGSVKAKGKLQGRIQCGGALKINSEFIKGTFICDVVRHHGDNWGRDWDTEIEGVPYAK